MSNIWADEPELVTRLIDLWNKGMTAQAISHAFRGKVSRCGVIGKIGRLRKEGIELRAPGHAKGPLKSNPKPPKLRIVKTPPPEAVGPVEDFPRTWNLCRYIIGDVNEPGWRTCGNEGYPFCEYHRAVCYIPPEKKHANQSS